MRFKWRKWNNILHRDLGYLCVGLTLVYAISGIAVNHIHDWNPNYVVEQEELRFAPIEVADRATMVAQLVKRLDLAPNPVDAFRPTPEIVEIFYEDYSVRAEATRGIARVVRTTPRALFYDLNFLHLNTAKGWWTWVADLYAGLLALLALTGMFVIKGKKGLGGRGKWWVSAGLVVPIAFLTFLRYL